MHSACNHIYIYICVCVCVCVCVYEGGPQNNWNLNVARELEIVARCAAKCRESTQYSSSLPRGVIKVDCYYCCGFFLSAC